MGLRVKSKWREVERLRGGGMGEREDKGGDWKDGEVEEEIKRL